MVRSQRWLPFSPPPLPRAAVPTAFLVGLAASWEQESPWDFAEALSDDGSLTGRGHPWVRGAICGLMTAMGGIGHTLPFLIHNFHLAMTAAVLVVAVELGGHQLRPPSLHGHTVSLRRLSGGGGRGAGVFDGDFDRKLIVIGAFVHRAIESLKGCPLSVVRCPLQATRRS